MGIILFFYGLVILIFLVFSVLLTQVVYKHCSRNDRARNWIQIYWVGIFVILGFSIFFGLALNWSGA